MPFAIAAGHELTRETAKLIIENGGNAFDAAIAAYTTMFICEPAMASAGAGGFALTHVAGAETKVFDFFSQTPLTKKETSLLDYYPIQIQFEDDSEEFNIGLASATVPGALAGIFELHKQYGSIPIKELFHPAVNHCKTGVPLDKFQAYDILLLKSILKEDPDGLEVFFDAGQIKTEGQLIQMPKAADFLDFIGKEGTDEFYRGGIAHAICKDSEARGGHLTREDFENYKVHVHDPMRLDWKDYNIAIPAFPSIGSYGLALYFGLTQKEGLSDADALIYTAKHIREKEKVINKISELFQDNPVEWHHNLIATKGTSHFSIIDRQGNAIALTTSIGEGCGYFIPNTQMHLNNMLGETYLQPNGSHSWIPNMRLNSMMCPTMVFENEALRIISGSGGASRIPVAITQVLKNIIVHKMSLEEATCASRMHFQEDVLHLEADIDAAIPNGNFTIKRWSNQSLFFGGVNSILNNKKGQLEAFSDKRRFGSAGIYE